MYSTRHSYSGERIRTEIKTTIVSTSVFFYFFTNKSTVKTQLEYNVFSKYTHKTLSEFKHSYSGERIRTEIKTIIVSTSVFFYFFTNKSTVKTQLEYNVFSKYTHKTLWEFKLCIEVWFWLYGLDKTATYYETQNMKHDSTKEIPDSVANRRQKGSKLKYTYQPKCRCH